MNELVGIWIAVSAIVSGKELPAEVVGALRLTMTAERYKTERGEQVLFDSTYKLDPKKSPKTITMVGTEDFAGKDAVGIYNLEKDTLTICYMMPGSPTPTNFASAPGSGAFLVTWKRQTAK